MRPIWLCTLALLAIVGRPAAADLPSSADVAARADAYLRAQAEAGFFSGAVLIARGGVPVFAKGYGYANAEWEIPNSTDTRFRIASITKTFTAAMVLLLHETQRLDVGASVCTYLDPCPDAWRPVTVHHLLTHTAGVPNYTDVPDFLDRARTPRPPAEILALVRDRPLEFAPGSRYRYSNSGYLMLGLILERAGGAPYDRLLDSLILGPLGLRDTGFDRPAPVLPRRASGYRPDGLALAPADHLEMSWVYAAGGMYSTVGDLLKWEQALSRGDLLPRRVVDRMWAAGVGPYGYGWQVLAPSAQTLQRPLVLHAGGLNGFATDLLRYPGEDLTVVILANLGTVPLPRISRDLSAIALGEAYTPPVVRRPMVVDPAIYDTYAGVYQLTPQVSVSVAREGDRLIVQATGQPRDVAIPESETRFFSRLVDGQITFAKDAGGRVTQLVIHQGGKDLVASRVPHPAP